MYKHICIRIYMCIYAYLGGEGNPDVPQCRSCPDAPARVPGVLQRVAACFSVLQRVAVCCSVLQRVAACCSALHCCTVLQMYRNTAHASTRVPGVLQFVAACCSVLQCVAACCIVLQCCSVTVCCSVSQSIAVCCSVLQMYRNAAHRWVALCSAPHTSGAMRCDMVPGSVLQRVCGSMCVAMLRCVSLRHSATHHVDGTMLADVVIHSTTSPHTYCNTHAATRCNTLQHTTKSPRSVTLLSTT